MKALKFLWVLIVAFSNLFALNYVKDICISDLKTEGRWCFSCCGFTGGVGCEYIINLKSMTDEPLTDVNIIIKKDGVDGNFISSCEIDDNEVTEEQCKYDEMFSVYPIGLFTRSIFVNMPDFSSYEEHKIGLKSKIKASIFENLSVYAKYLKDGKEYYGIVPKCDDINNINDTESTGRFLVVNENFNGSVNDIVKKLHTKIVRTFNNLYYVYYVVHTADDGVTLQPVHGKKVVEVDLIETPQNQDECSQKETIDAFYVDFDNNSSSSLYADFNNTNKNVTFRIKYPTYDIPDACLELIRGHRNRHRLGHQYGNTIRREAGEQAQNLALCMQSIAQTCVGSLSGCMQIPLCIAECSFQQAQQYGNEVMNQFQNIVNWADLTGLRETHRFRHRFRNGVRCVLECLFASSESMCSSDNFAIRPDKFDINKTSEPLIAGGETKITIHALGADGNVSDLNDKLNIVVTAKDKKGCEGNKVWTFNNQEFINGELNITIKYPEVGDVNFTIKEDENAPYAVVDKDEDSNDELYIKEGNKTVGTFWPAKFDVVLNAKNYKNADFTYIGDNNLDNMAGNIEINITAKNAENAVTKNYSTQCYGGDNNIQIKAKYQTITNSLEKISFKAKDTTNQIQTNINNPIDIQNLNLNFSEGKANAIVLVNFKKDYKNPVEPFDLNITEINVTDVTHNISSGVVNITANNLIHYVYGRINIPDVTGYGTVVRNGVKFEYFDNSKWLLNKNHTADFGNIDVTNTVVNGGGVTLQIDPVSNGSALIKYTLTNATPPVTKTVHYAVPEWLWYSVNANGYALPTTVLDCKKQPCNKVTFLPYGSSTTNPTSGSVKQGWAGVGEDDSTYAPDKNRTIKFNSNNKDTEKGVKKLNW